MIKKLNLFLFFSIIFCLITSNFSKANIKPETEKSIVLAIKYLEKNLKYFENLHCSQDDEFCWWFLFHLRIGDTGSSSMQDFASQVPISPQGKFRGEGHIFQFPAYWLLKGIPLETELSNNWLVDEYIQDFEYPSRKRLSKLSDKEPSWYLIGSSLYTDLMPISPIYKEAKACSGSHYLVGLYASGDERLFNRELNSYLNKLNQVIQYPPEEVLEDPAKADLIMHSFETLCLTGHRDLIQKDLFIYNLRFLVHFQKKFDALIKNNSSLQPIDILKQNENLAFAIADMLGHFRYGLKVCAEKEPNRLKYN